MKLNNRQRIVAIVAGLRFYSWGLTSHDGMFICRRGPNEYRVTSGYKVSDRLTESEAWKLIWSHLGGKDYTS